MWHRRALGRALDVWGSCAAAEPLEGRRLLTEVGSALANVIVGPTPTVQQEPSLAVNPRDSDHVVLAWLTEPSSHPGTRGIAVGVSHDGGVNWTHGDIALPADFADSADLPIMRFAADGRVFVSFQATGLNSQSVDIVPMRGGNKLSITPQHFQTNSGIFVASSADGGLHWDSPTLVSGQRASASSVPFDAQPDIVIDNFATRADGSPNPNFGNIYVAWTRFFPAGTYPGRPDFKGGGAPMLAISRDGGHTWETSTRVAFIPFDANRNGMFEREEFFPAVVSGIVEDLALFAEPGEASSFATSPRLAVGPDGDVYVGANGGGTFTFFHSSDGGRTFLPPNRETEQRVVFGSGFFARAGLPRTPQDPNAGMVRAIVADPTHPGRIYATEALFIESAATAALDVADIFVARSDDHGVTWNFDYSENTERPLTNRPVNDENGGESAKPSDTNPLLAFQGLPALAIDETGTLAAIWHDSRRGVRNEVLDVFGAVAPSGGQKFSPNFRISDESSPLVRQPQTATATPLAKDLGQRLSFEIVNGTGYAAWTDFRNGQADIAFSRFALSPVPASLNDRLEPNDTPESAVSLGNSVQVLLPKLKLATGESDWFAITSPSIGQLTIALETTADPHWQAGEEPRLRLELWDAAGTALLSSAVGVISQTGVATASLSRIVQSGEPFLIRVASVVPPGQSGLPDVTYALSTKALTQDFGVRVQANTVGRIGPGQLAVYRVVTPASGAEQAVAASVSPGLEVTLIDAVRQTPLNSQSQTGPGFVATAGLVAEDQVVLVLIRNTTENVIDFALSLRNLDGAATPGNRLTSLNVGSAIPAVGDFDNDGVDDLVASFTVESEVAVLPSNGDGDISSGSTLSSGASLECFRLQSRRRSRLPK